MPIMPDLPKAEAAVIELTNAFRAGSRLAAQASEPKLAKAARDYARFLAAAPLFSHEADGRRPADRIKAAGYDPCRVAENLAWLSDSRGFETRELAAKLVEGWKGSPSHRANMLLEHTTETGVAVAKAKGEEKYFAVQLFGRPASLRYQFQVDNGAQRPVSYSLGGQRIELKPNAVMRHTACEPETLVFETKRGGLVARPVTARYEARDGQVYRLSADRGGELRIEVGAR